MVAQTGVDSEAASLLDGKALAKTIRKELKERVAGHLDRGNRAPGLAVVLVGDDPASEIYVRNKINTCKKIGIQSILERFGSDASCEDVLTRVRELNKRADVDGILVQLPLPDQLDEDEILETVSPDKDADGLTCANLGSLMAGKTAARPCTPQGVITLLARNNIDLKGKNAVVVGRSRLVGKPVALLLMEQHATVTICHSRTRELESVVRSADILVVAMGKARFVKGSWIKPGAVVVDVGIHHEKGVDGQSSICGDVEFEEASKVASWITPVPGGVGPMTVAQLMVNTVDSYEKRLKGEAD